MKIALFTSNQPRHLSLINSFACITDELFVVSEVTTLFPCLTADFYNSTEVMKSYFSKMQQAEQKIFGEPNYLTSNVQLMPIKMGDINSIPMDWFRQLADIDYAIVFGASWIKRELYINFSLVF